MKKLLLVCALVLTGCVTEPQIITKTMEVKVPVPVPYPEPPTIDRPKLVIYQLNEADKKDPGKVVQYYQATVKQLMGYSLQLEKIIDGYRKPKDSQK